MNVYSAASVSAIVVAYTEPKIGMSLQPCLVSVIVSCLCSMKKAPDQRKNERAARNNSAAFQSGRQILRVSILVQMFRAAGIIGQNLSNFLDL